ncbi:arsenic resistance protein [Brachybacterium sp. DNPG3]
MIAAWDRHQIPLYVAAIALGAVIGLAAPSLAPALETAITPVLALLLLATFLGVPLLEVGRALRDVRFLIALLVADFVLVPVIAAVLTRFVADDPALLIGALLVLLAPCVDYVIVFTGLAGGDRTRLLAAAPLLMLLQMMLLPPMLALLAGPEALAAVSAGPFAAAFVQLIVLPLAAAGIVQGLARRGGSAPSVRTSRALETIMAGAMVPLMMATLAVVIGSQIAAVGGSLGPLARLVPVYAVFAVLALAAGRLVSRVARLDVSATRAVMMSACTRNSLVVLPLALALPARLGLAPLAVVLQTLVELVAMVMLVRALPRIAP